MAAAATSPEVHVDQVIRVHLKVSYSDNGTFKGFESVEKPLEENVLIFPQILVSDHCSQCSSKLSIVIESFSINPPSELDETVEIKSEPDDEMPKPIQEVDSPAVKSHKTVKDIIKSCHLQCLKCLSWFRKDVYEKHVSDCRKSGDETPTEATTKTDKKYMCHFCGAQFKFPALYRYHMATHAYNDPKPFKCELCGSAFTNKNNIRTHMLQVHMPYDQKRFVCVFCPNKRFGQRSFLKAHMAAQHRLAKCDICQKTYSSAIYLREHKILVHTKAEDQRYSHQCDQCDEVFTQRKYLRTHKVRRHKEKRFKCEVETCAKEFSFPYAFRRHMAVHADERPFICSVCGNSYRTKTYLKSHLRLHTGQKPYVCEVCQTRFSDSGCYRSHLLLHEKRLGISLDKSIKKFKVYD